MALPTQARWPLAQNTQTLPLHIAPAGQPPLHPVFFFFFLPFPFFFLPAAASTQVRERASTFLRASLIQPDVAAAMAPLAAHVEPTTIDQHTARMKADSEFAGRLVKTLGFRADS